MERVQASVKWFLKHFTLPWKGAIKLNQNFLNIEMSREMYKNINI